MPDRKAHRTLGIDLFNAVWTLLEKKRRSRADDDRMLHSAHASRLHWELGGGKPVNLVRGEWQVSRVYAVLRHGEPALRHARRCLELCRAHGLGDFDLAYAYEALARASAVAGRKADARGWLARARRAALRIREADDREWFLKDLSTVPG